MPSSRTAWRGTARASVFFFFWGGCYAQKKGEFRVSEWGDDFNLSKSAEEQLLPLHRQIAEEQSAVDNFLTQGARRKRSLVKLELIQHFLGWESLKD